MKNLLTLLCLMSMLVLWACEDGSSTAKVTTTESEVDNPTVISAPTCQRIGSYEIAQSCADSAMLAWDDVVANIKSQYKGSDTQYLVRGFAVRSSEIDSMQAELAMGANDTIFGMLAIERVNLGGGNYENQTKIIFMGTPAAANAAEAAPTGYKYFNFTTPCPNTCPKN